MLYTIFLVLDVLLCIALVVLILLHRGRGSEVGAAFAGGGGASGTVFGSKGATSFMTRLIAILAALFLMNSLTLAYVANRSFSEESFLQQVEEAAERQEIEAASQEEEDVLPAEESMSDPEVDDTAPEVPN